MRNSLQGFLVISKILILVLTTSRPGKYSIFYYNEVRIIFYLFYLPYYIVAFSCSLFPVPCSLFPVPCSIKQKKCTSHN
ncbi:MAG: hypothetical protein F6K26_55330 [Moorea sp. SIO2I5]|nr:hypothetical protein [Moorena sp. SIO2I5]